MAKRKLTVKTKHMLLMLANFLETKVKPKWFDLESWGTKGFTKKECGTTACAIGWATVCFPESGLKLVPSRVLDGNLNITHGRFRGIAAAKKFFDLDKDTAECLFLPEHYPWSGRGRMDVVRRIRKVVKDPSVVDALVAD